MQEKRADISLPPASRWRLAHHTRQGLAHVQSGRPNEDAVAIGVGASGVQSVAVADGVGSGERGDLASALVARHWVAAGAPPDPAQALGQARLALADCEAALASGLQAAGLPGQGASGSMLVGAWLYPSGDVVLGHVGDCRAYRVHRGALQPLTRDHTYRNLGLQQPHWRQPDDPARMVGDGLMGPPDVQRVRLASGDWLLMCSDGLHGAFPPAGLAERLQAVWAAANHPFGGYREGLLQVISSYLASQAVKAGGRDDVSLALALCQGNPVSPLTAVGGATARPADGPDSVWPSDDFQTASS